MEGDIRLDWLPDVHEKTKSLETCVQTNSAYTKRVAPRPEPPVPSARRLETHAHSSRARVQSSLTAEAASSTGRAEVCPDARGIFFSRRDFRVTRRLERAGGSWGELRSPTATAAARLLRPENECDRARATRLRPVNSSSRARTPADASRARWVKWKSDVDARLAPRALARIRLHLRARRDRAPPSVARKYASPRVTRAGTLREAAKRARRARDERAVLDLPGARVDAFEPRRRGARGARAYISHRAGATGTPCPAALVQPAGLTFRRPWRTAACFAFGLMVLVGSLRPALVVLPRTSRCAVSPAHRAVDGAGASSSGRSPIPSTAGSTRSCAPPDGGAAWTYIVIVPISSTSCTRCSPAKWSRPAASFAVGPIVRQRYLARFAGRGQKTIGKAEPVDLIPASGVRPRDGRLGVEPERNSPRWISLGVQRVAVQPGGRRNVDRRCSASVAWCCCSDTAAAPPASRAPCRLLQKAVVRVLLSGRARISAARAAVAVHQAHVRAQRSQPGVPQLRDAVAQ